MQNCPNCGERISKQHKPKKGILVCRNCNNEYRLVNKFSNYVVFIIGMSLLLYVLLDLLGTNFWTFTFSAMISSYLSSLIMQLLKTNEAFAWLEQIIEKE